MNQPAHDQKVCIVSPNPVRDDLCNGIMIQSLFADWQSSQLSHIHFSVLKKQNPNVLIDSAAFRISIFGKSAHITQDVCCQDNSIRDLKPSGKVTSSIRDIIVRNRKALGVFRGVHELWAANCGLIANCLINKLKEIKPDVVYVHIGSYWISKVSLKACHDLKIPMVLHVTDDFVNGLYEDVICRKLFKSLARKWFKRAVQYADLNIAISPDMAKQFSRQYGGSWDWSTTLVNPANYDPSPRTSNSKFQIVYAGSLGLNRIDSLSAVAKSVAQLKSTGKDLVLDVWCSDFDKKLFLSKYSELSPSCNFCGWADPAKLPFIFHNADLLVHLESFRKKDISFTKLSLSTKISQYLMAGRPVMAVAPEELASVNVLKESGGCVGVCKNELQDISKCLLRCLASASELQSFGSKGLAWALKNSSTRTKRKHVEEEIKEIVNNKR